MTDRILNDGPERGDVRSVLTVGALLRWGEAGLAGAGAPAGQSAGTALDAEVLLAHVLGVTRARLRSHPEATPDAAQRQHYAALIARRMAGEPLAYLVGYREFWSLRLCVTPAVLVPRPETELLVQRSLELLTEPAAQVADLGTGSGAIALALASERPGWHVVATDSSIEALAVARHNAQQLGLTPIELLCGAWLAPLAGRRFHLLVSNPPYVAGEDPLLREAPLRFEPRSALSPGPDALRDLRAIVAGAPEHLLPGGWLMLEHGADQAAPVRDALVARGFAHVRSHRDLAGHERVTEARWG